MTVSDRIRVNVRLLSDNHYMLKTTTFEWRRDAAAIRGAEYFWVRQSNH
jgi:hypothetical protein